MSNVVNVDAATRASVNQNVSLGVFSGSPKVQHSRTIMSDATIVYASLRTVVGSETLNLASGTLKDAFGVSVNFTNLLGLQVENLDDTNSLVVGTGSNAVLGTDQITIKPLRTFLSDSEHVVDGSHLNLLLTVSAGVSSSASSGTPSLSYNIILYGT